MKARNNIIISVIIPTYNRSALISRAIDSIKAQTFNDWECIIVDDHSTDDTLYVVRELIKDDNRFTCLENIRKKGAPGARNTGVLNAHGDFLVFFDSDNCMSPYFLEKVYTSLINNNADGCASFSRIIDEDTGKQIGSFQWLGYGRVYRDVLRGISYFDNSSTLIRRQKVLDIGLLDEDCPAFQEWDTHIRISRIANYSTVEEELIDYYRGGADTISKSVLRSIEGRLYILKKFKMDFIWNVPFTYLKYCFGVFCNIRSLRSTNKIEYERLLNQYNETFDMVVIGFVKILFFIRDVKNRINIINN